jgi:hypothetical protein
MNEIPTKELRRTWNIYTAMYRIEKKIISTAWGIFGGNYGKLYPEHIQTVYRLLYKEFSARHPRCKWAKNLKVPSELKNCSKIRFIMLHDTKYIKELDQILDDIFFKYSVASQGE